MSFGISDKEKRSVQRHPCISPVGYAALHVPRYLSADRDSLSRGSGLSIVYRESVVVRKHRLADKFRPSTCELQVVRVNSSPILAYVVLHIYRPPWMSTVPAFADELGDMIATVAAKCNDHIIHLRRSELPRYGQFPRRRAPVNSVRLFRSVRTDGLCVDSRQQFAGRSCVQSSVSVVRRARVRDAGLVSDHRFVTARLVCSRTKVKTSYRFRNIRAIGVFEFDRALCASTLFTAPAVTADGFADQLRDVVTTLLDKFAPLRTGVRHRPKSSNDAGWQQGLRMIVNDTDGRVVLPTG